MAISSNGEASPSVVYDWMALNVVNALLNIGGKGSYFKHTIETHMSFAREFYTQAFTDMKFNKEVCILMEKTHDYECSAAVHLILPGIIGNKTTATTHNFPYLIDSQADCTFATGSTACVPAQEDTAMNFDFDFESTTASTQTAVATEHRYGRLTTNPFCHWIDGAGLRFIEYMKLNAGNLKAEILDYRLLYAWEELSGAAGKRQTYQVGSADTREELIMRSLRDQHLYINIPFWFTYFYGNSLSVVRSQLAKLSFALKSARVEELVVCSDEYTVPYLSKASTDTNWAITDFVSYEQTPAHDRAVDTASVLANSQAVTCELVQEVVYLEDGHRKVEIAAAETQEQNVLMIVNEGRSVEWTTIPSSFNVSMEGTNPVIEVLIMCQLKVNELMNRPFDFSRVGPQSGGNLRHTVDLSDIPASNTRHETRRDQPDADVISTFQLLANKQARFHSAPAAEFRIYAPSLAHTNLPSASKGAYIYCVPIALFPEAAEKGSGSINMGRINNLALKGTFHPGVVGQCQQANAKGLTMYVYVRFWTIWTYYGHTSGPRFNHQFDFQ
jgi:hypothetical protein